MNVEIVVYDVEDEDDLENLKQAILEAGYKIESVLVLN